MVQLGLGPGRSQVKSSGWSHWLEKAFCELDETSCFFSVGCRGRKNTEIKSVGRQEGWGEVYISSTQSSPSMERQDGSGERFAPEKR